MKNQKVRQMLFVSLIAIIGVIFLLGTKSDSLEKTVEIKPVIEVEPTPKEESSSVVFDVDLKAQAAAVYDLGDGKFIYQENVDKVFPLASLTKIMTAYVALDETQPDELVKLSRNAVGQPGDEGLLVDDSWLVDDLVNIMLTSSSNDAAVAVQEHFANGSSKDAVGVNNFIRLMNKKANFIGLENTQFLDGSGLDITEKLGSSFGSLKDVLLMVTSFVDAYPQVAIDSSRSEVMLVNNGRDYVFLNTNEILDDLGSVVFSKTGYTDVAGGHVVVVVKIKGREYFIGIMGSTFYDRFSDLDSLVRAFLQSGFDFDRI